MTIVLIKRTIPVFKPGFFLEISTLFPASVYATVSSTNNNIAGSIFPLKKESQQDVYK